MKKMILLYKAKDEVHHILDELKLPYKDIHDNMLHETLGYLFELDGFHTINADKEYHYDIDLMLIHGIDDELLNIVTLKMKEQNVNIERKAMLTKHNQHWQMFALIEEIEKEHTYFKYYDRIIYLIKEAEQFQNGKYAAEPLKFYQEAIMEAYMLIQQKIEDLDMMHKALRKLESARAKLME